MVLQSSSRVRIAAFRLAGWIDDVLADATYYGGCLHVHPALATRAGPEGPASDGLRESDRAGQITELFLGLLNGLDHLVYAQFEIQPSGDGHEPVDPVADGLRRRSSWSSTLLLNADDREGSTPMSPS